MLDFRKANFDVLRAVVREALGAQGVASMGVQKRWSFLKEAILGAQQDAIPLRRKAGKGSKKPSWLSADIQAGLRAKKKAYWWWKQGAGTKEEYTSLTRACRDLVRKAKAALELILASGIKDNKKSFFKYIGTKKSRGNIGPL